MSTELLIKTGTKI